MKVILKICEINNVRGTFFILGEVAEKYPDLVREVSAQGHEIGVHGYKHDQIFRHSKESLRRDLTRAKELLSRLSGQEINGFRAPAFSINKKTSWALTVIAECGFKYDSSIFPSLSMRYGWKGFCKDICKLELDSGQTIIEVPLSVKRMFGREIPIGGGGYLRYFPYQLTRRALNLISEERPAIVYVHPYELDVKKYPEYFHDAINQAPLKKKIMLSLYRLKKHTVAPKLDQLMKDFELVPIEDIITDLKSKNIIPTVKF